MDPRNIMYHCIHLSGQSYYVRTQLIFFHSSENVQNLLYTLLSKLYYINAPPPARRRGMERGETPETSPTATPS